MTEQTPPAASTPAPMLESDARTMAMLVNVISAAGAVLSGGTLSFIAILVMWLMYRERSALVDHHGKQQINLSITVLIASVAAVVIGFATLFIGFFVTIPLLIAYGIYALVISIIAAVAASRGEYYRIPAILTLVK